MSAREEVLGRLRAALDGAPPAPVQVPRGYRGAGADDGLPREQVVDELVDRLEDYRATVERTSSADLPARLAAVLDRLGDGPVVVPAGLDEGWLTALPEGTELLRDDPPLDVEALDREGAVVVTACAVAVARTGTIVLDGDAGQGRRVLTLVPDRHVLVVRADQVVPAVPDAVARLDPVRPLTWISGPSATSDIELQRVEGVHGPRTLVVLVVEG